MWISEEKWSLSTGELLACPFRMIIYHCEGTPDIADWTVASHISQPTAPPRWKGVCDCLLGFARMYLHFVECHNGRHTLSYPRGRSVSNGTGLMSYNTASCMYLLYYKNESCTAWLNGYRFSIGTTLHKEASADSWPAHMRGHCPQDKTQALHIFIYPVVCYRQVVWLSDLMGQDGITILHVKANNSKLKPTLKL